MQVAAMTSSSTSRRAEEKLNPSRIRLARERRGMSKVALSPVLGVTKRILQTYETDGAPLSRSGDLAEALDVAPEFFMRRELAAISVG